MSIIKQFYDIMMYYLTGMDLSPLIIITHMSVSLLMSLVIYFVYKITYSGVVYTKSFNVSLVIITLVTTVVMMIIRSSVALSLGMVGALSIVRFRTAVKQPKDIAYMFWAITTGLSVGSGAYLLAIICGLFVTAVLLVFRFSKSEANSYLLVLKGEKCDKVKLQQEIATHTKRHKIRTKNIEAKKFEYMYEVQLKSKDEDEIVEAMNNIGIEHCNLIAYENDIGN